MALEENTLKIHQQAALEEVQGEYPEFFDRIKVHPRLLVGTQVRSLSGEGMETLRDSADARDWQEGVKSLLAAEVQERTGKRAEGDNQIMNVLHSSIELFQNNPDLVPGTTGFDKDLADRLTSVTSPYKVIVDGKLHGYSIPVQPLINQLRTAIAAERSAARSAATPPPAAANAAGGGTGAPPPAPAPQKGITSKPGSSGGSDNDFSVLFGTLGMPGFRI